MKQDRACPAGKHDGDGKQLAAWQSMVSGGSAAILGPTMTNPFDVIKVRMHLYTWTAAWRWRCFLLDRMPCHAHMCAARVHFCSPGTALISGLAVVEMATCNAAITLILAPHRTLAGIPALSLTGCL